MKSIGRLSVRGQRSEQKFTKFGLRKSYGSPANGMTLDGMTPNDILVIDVPVAKMTATTLRKTAASVAGSER